MKTSRRFSASIVAGPRPAAGVSAQTKNPASSAANAGGASERSDWAYVGHDAGGMRYSPLKQINVDNVKNLTVAWTYHVGDISDGKGFARRSGFETTPILVDGTLFFTTPFNRVIALDPETGKERWTFDPMVDTVGDYGDGLINRGVATWLDPETREGRAVPPPDFRSHARRAPGRAGRRQRNTLRGFWKSRPGQPAGCRALPAPADIT